MTNEEYAREIVDDEPSPITERDIREMMESQWQIRRTGSSRNIWRRKRILKKN